MEPVQTFVTALDCERCGCQLDQIDCGEDVVHVVVVWDALLVVGELEPVFLLAVVCVEVVWYGDGSRRARR